MASSGYQAWSVIAGETPTTTKWNMLGSNDASFNTGNGFNDGIITGRHLGLKGVTDANGWTVYDYGNFKEATFTRSETGLAYGLLAAGGNSYGPATIPLPVGVANISILKNWTQGFQCNDRIFFCVERSALTDTSFTPFITSLYSSTANLTYYRIDLRVVW